MRTQNTVQNFSTGGQIIIPKSLQSFGDFDEELSPARPQFFPQGLWANAKRGVTPIQKTRTVGKVIPLRARLTS